MISLSKIISVYPKTYSWLNSDLRSVSSWNLLVVDPGYVKQCFCAQLKIQMTFKLEHFCFAFLTFAEAFRDNMLTLGLALFSLLAQCYSGERLLINNPLFDKLSKKTWSIEPYLKSSSNNIGDSFPPQQDVFHIGNFLPTPIYSN